MGIELYLYKFVIYKYRYTDTESKLRYDEFVPFNYICIQ